MGRNSNQNDKLHSTANMQAIMRMTLAKFQSVGVVTAQMYLERNDYDMCKANEAIEADRAEGKL